MQGSIIELTMIIQQFKLSINGKYLQNEKKYNADNFIILIRVILSIESVSPAFEIMRLSEFLAVMDAIEVQV